MDYTDIASVEDYILQDISPSFEPRVSKWIKAMSRHMDEVTKRRLCLVPSDSDDMLETYKYDGDNTQILLVSDCHSVEEVKVDGVVVTDFVTYPSNKPYVSRLARSGSKVWPKGQQNITVEAVQAAFGANGEVPEDIKFACTVLVGGICNNQISQGEGTTEKIGNYTITYDKSQEADVNRAKDIIAGYTRIAVG